MTVIQARRAFFRFARVGVCVLSVGCSAQRSGPSGVGGSGGSTEPECEKNADCVAGMGCYDVGRSDGVPGRCVPVCDPAEPCSDPGDVCKLIGENTAGEDLWICQEPTAPKKSVGEPCASDQQCASSYCMGYCSRACDQLDSSSCPEGTVCAGWEPGGLCAPICAEDADCAVFGGGFCGDDGLNSSKSCIPGAGF